VRIPYRDLPRQTFDAVIEMLSEGIAARRGRYGAYLHRDRVNDRLRARRGARLAAITGGGAIPDTALYNVVQHPEGNVVGTVDEDFAVESLAGDIFLLGNTSWRIRRVGIRTRAGGRRAGRHPDDSILAGRSAGANDRTVGGRGEIRQTIDRLAPDARPDDAGQRQPAAAAAVAWLQEHCGLDSLGAEQAVDFVVAGRAVLGGVPTQTRVIAERFFDEGGGMQLVLHAPFGGRINRAWGLALRKRFCRSFNFELQASATDDGVNIGLAEQHSFPLGDVFRFLSETSVQDVLEQAVLDSPLFGPLALGRQPIARASACARRQARAAAYSANSVRRLAGLGIP
jgi:ATP-dependent Lhr-like helicase